MATETELERLIVRIQGDATQYMRTLNQTGIQTKAAAEGMKRAGEQGERSFHLSHRGVHVLSNSLVHLAHMKGPEEMLQSLTHVAHGLGYSFGITGILAAAGIGVAIAAAQKLNESLGDKAKKAANEAFGAVIDGSKRASEAMASIGTDKLGKDLKDLWETLNPTTPAGKFVLGAKLTAHGVATSPAGTLTNVAAAISGVGGQFLLGGGKLEDKAIAAKYFADEMARIAQETMDAEKQMEKFATSSKGRAVIDLFAQKSLKSLREEAMYTAHTLDMTAGEKKGYDLASRLTSNALKEEAKWLARWNELTAEGGQKMRQLADGTEKYGKTDLEFLADQLDKVGNKTLAKNLRDDEASKLVRDLTHDWEKFSMAMGGATKAQLAMAEATDPVAKALAYEKALMTGALQAVEQTQTPLEKFNQTHKETSELYRRGAIGLETYTRAMAKAKQQAEGTAEAIQAVGVGTSEGLIHLLQYRQAISAANIPAPLTKEQIGTGKSDEQKKILDDQLLRLTEILAELRKRQNAPTLTPANVGGQGL